MHVTCHLRLGHNNTETKLVPTYVKYFELKGTKIGLCSAGSFHSLVVSTQGELFAFGSNNDGQLGIFDAHSDGRRDQLEPKSVNRYTTLAQVGHAAVVMVFILVAE
jgi:alpha-tubulin suppressor-like RCC1 family protein